MKHSERRPVRLPIVQTFLVLSFCITLAACSKGDQTETTPAKSEIIVYEETSAAGIPSNPLREALFGETHVHAAYSLDAYIGGNRLTPSDAYRFARGETVTVDGEAHTPALNASVNEANSEMPVLGYTVPYAISNVLLTLLGPVIVLTA